MAFEARNFVINRVRRALMYHSTTGEVMWSIIQVSNPTLNVTTETQEAVDAIGNRILSFDRAKNAEFSAENTQFDLGLLAAQSGTTKKISADTNKISMPLFHEFVVPDTGTTVTLPKAPAGAAAAGIPFIYAMHGDGSLSVKYAYGASAGANTFTYTGTTLTFPTGSTPGTRFFVPYEYETDETENNGGSAVDVTAVDFPKAGRFVLEVIGADPCDVSTEYYAFVVFPNAKLLGNFDITFTTEGAHPFTIQANQDYCDPEKRLFTIAIPEA